MTNIKVREYLKELLVGVDKEEINQYLYEFFTDVQYSPEMGNSLTNTKIVDVDSANGDFHDSTDLTITLQDITSGKYYQFVISDSGAISEDAITVDSTLVEVNKTGTKQIYK